MPSLYLVICQWVTLPIILVASHGGCERGTNNETIAETGVARALRLTFAYCSVLYHFYASTHETQENLKRGIAS